MTEHDEEGIDAERAGPAPGIISPVPIAKLTPEQSRGLELNRQFVQVVGAIGSMSWGKGLTPGIRRSIAEYCRHYDVDPLTELDVLGGNFYVNSEWYLRRLGDLRRQGIVADFWLEHIHADPRLKALMEDTTQPEPVREEARRRWTAAMFKRVEHNAPENAEAICLCFIVLPNGGHAIVGCKWGGGGTSIKQARGQGQTAPNPIVENNAALSVESQAVRRAMRQVQSHVSTGLVPNFEQMEEDLTALSTRVGAVVSSQEAVDERLEREHHAPRALATQGMEGYGFPERAAQGEEPVAVYRRDASTREMSLEQIQHVAETMPDPYNGEVAFREPPSPPPGLPMREVVPIVLEPDGAPASARSREAAREEYASTVAVGTQRTCDECKELVRVGHPEDHNALCSKYAD